jgi:cofilin
VYDDFLVDLKKAGAKDCRYGIFDFEYTHQCQGTTEVMNASKYI